MVSRRVTILVMHVIRMQDLRMLEIFNDMLLKVAIILFTFLYDLFSILGNSYFLVHVAFYLLLF